MAYHLKSPIGYKNYLDNYIKENPFPSNYEENLINNFNSCNLSDLYKLFINLKNRPLTNTLFSKLQIILVENFGINFHSNFLTFPESEELLISDDNIKELESIIKDTFLRYVENPKLEINKDELYKLTVIVNKAFPDVFLQLVTSPDGNIENQQNFIKNKILETLNHWHNHNLKASKQEIADIAGAFYIVAKKLYPDLSIYLPGRIKSTKSSISNINKELNLSLSSLVPSDFSKGLTDEDIKQQFNIDAANTDFTGFTVVLPNVSSTFHIDKTDPKSPELLALKKSRDEHIRFTHKLENFLLDNEGKYLSNIDLLQIKIELLIRLRQDTYDECINEFRNTSFNELAKSAIQQFYEEIESSNLKSFPNEFQYKIILDDIYSLLDELKKRIDDKYQNKLLEIAIPNILKEPIFSETLKVKPSFVKKIIKPNGFCSTYYQITTSDGKQIELQASSKTRFEQSKNGTSDHSCLPDKEIDISHFFEPASQDCDKEHFEYFLNLLNTTPLATKNILYNTQDTNLSPTDRRLKMKLKLAEENVKLKDAFELENVSPDGTMCYSKILIDTYLPLFAEYVSPQLMTISSPHTRFNKSIAGYDTKNIISGFIEVLLKHDSTSCLAQILIDKLETLLPSAKNKISLNGILNRAAQRNER